MPSSKAETICGWKRYGLIYDDYDELYEIYIKTMNCQHCNKEFKNSSYRCMDHDHATGKFRKIVCRACNVNDTYIKYPNGYTNEDLKKTRKEYRDNNKDKLKEYFKRHYQDKKKEISKKNREKTTCLCGSEIRKDSMRHHLKTQKHLNNMDKYMNNID